MSDELKNLKAEETRLENELDGVRGKIRTIEMKAWLEKHPGLEVGAVVLAGYGVRKVRYRVTRIGWRWDSPTVWGRKIKKDGTPGQREFDLYRWELEKPDG